MSRKKPGHHPKSSGQTAKEQNQRAVAKLNELSQKIEVAEKENNAVKMDELRAEMLKLANEAKVHQAKIAASHLKEESKADSRKLETQTNDLIKAHGLQTAAAVVSAVNAFAAGGKKKKQSKAPVSPAKVVKAPVDVVKEEVLQSSDTSEEEVIPPVVPNDVAQQQPSVFVEYVDSDEDDENAIFNILLPDEQAEENIPEDPKEDTSSEINKILLRARELRKFTINEQNSDDVQEEQQPAPFVGCTGPIYAALLKEVERLESKAEQAHGIEGFIWKSSYQAKAASARAAFDAIIKGPQAADGSISIDAMITAEIKKDYSDMHKALNTHSSYVFQFSTGDYGVPSSWKARALLNIEKVIDTVSAPAAGNEEVSSLGL